MNPILFAATLIIGAIISIASGMYCDFNGIVIFNTAGRWIWCIIGCLLALGLATIAEAIYEEMGRNR